MSIDITKAVDGSFYKVEYSEQLSEDILKGTNANFSAPCSVTGKYVVLDSVVYVDAILKTVIDYPCDKCLALSSMVIETEMTASYYREDRQVTEGEELIGDFPYKGFAIDLSSAVYQEMLLSIPSRLLCKKDCRGLCPICGVNLNINDCGCNIDSREQQLEQARNPFAQLKNLNFKSGGASNGGTKA